ncbi:glycosyltransferase [Candidatus Sumerlaeota bacterium]|nr:glycosyltransferase [Candidatus Sumerlaeota bacterium]
MARSDPQTPTILYVRPSDPRRTAIAEYADHFELALRRIEGAHVVTLPSPDVSERIDSKADRERAVRDASSHARLYRGFGSNAIVHVEQGNALHREFWTGWALMRGLPRARFFCTIHDPPTLCSNPYRYVRTEFEGRTPVRIANVALTKMAETVVGWRKRRVERRFVSGCRAALVLKEGGLDALRGAPLFRGPELVRIAHVFASDDASASVPRPERNVASPTIGMFCFLGPDKRIGDLLDAFDRVSERLAREAPDGARPNLAIFGAPQRGVETESFFEGVRARIARSPYRDRIDFSPGFIEESERDRRLAAIDILVLPFAPVERIAFSSAGLIRAMALGKAVVASQTGTVEEEVRDGQNGLVYPPGDVDALADRLHALVADPALRERIASAAAEHVRSEHSPEALASRLAQIYGI